MKEITEKTTNKKIRRQSVLFHFIINMITQFSNTKPYKAHQRAYGSKHYK